MRGLADSLREGAGVRRDREVRADPPPGRRAHPPRPGVRRLCGAWKKASKIGCAIRERGAGIGGSAVGTGINTHKDYAPLTVKHIQEITGFDVRLSPTYFTPCRARRFLMASGALRYLALELIRIANDLRLLSSGPMTGLSRDHAARRPARLFDHAGQGEPCNGRDARYGLLPGIGNDPPLKWRRRPGSLS